MTTSITPSQSYVEAFRTLAEHTEPKCGACRAAYICCTSEQCRATQDFALETFGIHLTEGSGPLPFLDESGCTVPPHLRPICSVHVCEQHITGDEWSEVYEDLREAAGTALEDEIERVSGIG